MWGLVKAGVGIACLSTIKAVKQVRWVFDDNLSHEIMVLFALHNFIHHTCMRSHPVD